MNNSSTLGSVCASFAHEHAIVLALLLAFPVASSCRGLSSESAVPTSSIVGAQSGTPPSIEVDSLDWDSFTSCEFRVDIDLEQRLVVKLASPLDSPTLQISTTLTIAGFGATQSIEYEHFWKEIPSSSTSAILLLAGERPMYALVLKEASKDDERLTTWGEVLYQGAVLFDVVPLSGPAERPVPPGATGSPRPQIPAADECSFFTKRCTFLCEGCEVVLHLSPDSEGACHEGHGAFRAKFSATCPPDAVVADERVWCESDELNGICPIGRADLRMTCVGQTFTVQPPNECTWSEAAEDSRAVQVTSMAAD